MQISRVIIFEAFFVFRKKIIQPCIALLKLKRNYLAKIENLNINYIHLNFETELEIKNLTKCE